MELTTVTRNNHNSSFSGGNRKTEENHLIPPKQKNYQLNPFIEANTKKVSLSFLQNDCVIPVFAKDNEKTLAHQEFIEITQDCLKGFYDHQNIGSPEIRVSHQIKGRTSKAIHKPAKELLPHEITQYYERMAFIIRIPTVEENINGNPLSLMVGGVRAFNHENLYGKKTFEKFKFFIGFQNMVCCNLCIATDGLRSEIKTSSIAQLKEEVSKTIENYQMEKHLHDMKSLHEKSLTESQFAQLIGKTRLYNYLPRKSKSDLPLLDFSDRQLNTVAKDYYSDSSFCREDNGSINIWNLYNLFTGANKSSYIDSFAERNVNAFEFSKGLSETLNGDSKYAWFMS